MNETVVRDQLPLWQWRITIDPGADQQQTFYVGADDTFEIGHPTEDRVVVRIEPLK